MAIIGVDVDLTVVRSDIGWFEWCNSISDYKHSPEEFINADIPVPYDVRPLYPDVNSDDIMHYWRKRNLYDNLSPIDGSVKVLEHLSKNHDIVFVSTLKGDHHKSKVNFLKTHFPFMKGFIGTKEKEYAKVDIIIDDRISILNKTAVAGTVSIQYNTPYTQDESLFHFPTINGWNDQSFELIKTLAHSLDVLAKGNV